MWSKYVCFLDLCRTLKCSTVVICMFLKWVPCMHSVVPLYCCLSIVWADVLFDLVLREFSDLQSHLLRQELNRGTGKHSEECLRSGSFLTDSLHSKTSSRCEMVIDIEKSIRRKKHDIMTLKGGAICHPHLTPSTYRLLETVILVRRLYWAESSQHKSFPIRGQWCQI